MSVIARAYLEREQDHVLRIAMLLQLSYTPGTLTVTKSAFDQALQIMRLVEKDAIDVIEWITTEPSMRSVRRIIEVMEEENRIWESDLIDRIWPYLRHPREFPEAMVLLYKAERVIGPLADSGRLYYEYKKKEEE